MIDWPRLIKWFGRGAGCLVSALLAFFGFVSWVTSSYSQDPFLEAWMVGGVVGLVGGALLIGLIVRDWPRAPRR